MKTFSSLVVAALLISCSGKTPDASAYMPETPSSVTGSGSDMYYELVQTTSVGRSGGTSQTLHTRMYLSATGAARVERESPKIPGRKIPDMVLIGTAGKKDETIVLDPEAKTYYINHSNPEDFKGAGEIVSTVTAEGNETILGFHSVRVRIISKKNYGVMKITDTMDLWKSSDVPVPSVFGDWMTTFENKSTGLIYAPDVPAKLKQLGCTGFTVKMEMHDKNSLSRLQLIKVDNRDLPADLFKVPAGYTITKEDQ